MQRPEKIFPQQYREHAHAAGSASCAWRAAFVFSSTAALYGAPENTPIEENSRLQPSNAYGESKLLVEQMLDWLHRVHGLRYACLRYFNAAGAAGEQGEDHSRNRT